MNLILLIVLAVVLLAVLSAWPYSRGWGWGYYPSGILVDFLLVLLIAGVL